MNQFTSNINYILYVITLPNIAGTSAEMPKM